MKVRASRGRPEQDPLVVEIQAALRVDQARGAKLSYGPIPPDTDSGPEFDGFCAAAAAAYLFLKGEEMAGQDPDAFVDTEAHWHHAGTAARAAGYRSFQRSSRPRWGPHTSHWWIERTGPDGRGAVIDLIYGPGDPPARFPYHEGRTRGFMQTGYRRPADRARALIEMVKLNRGSSPQGSSERDAV
jgi:hypothetical protein